MKFEPVIKWSGSKRALSEEIVSYFPKQIKTYYEPFCGSCSILFQMLHSDIKCEKYICSDKNTELIEYFKKVKENPIEIYKEYKLRWDELVKCKDITEKKVYYNSIRDRYNKSKNIFDFIFLSRTSANGLIRYNSKGEFNAPFHLTRNGINPERFKKILIQWSDKLNEFNVEFKNLSYEEIAPQKGDFVFLDPPYANTKGMYNGGIDLNKFWEKLSNYDCGYALTFDGKRTDVDNTYDVPENIYKKHIYLDGKISGFKKLHKDISYVRESLYIN